MPGVRPTGELGSLGLMLPTAPQGKNAPTFGTTKGSTPGAQSGGTDGSTGGPEPGTARALAQLCRDAELCGAGALWAVDHLFWPRPMLECLTTLAVAAAATDQVPIGTCVLQLPLRDPAVLAKQATALHLLSGGRFVLGLGVGSHPGEYVAAGVGFDERGRIMDEGLAQLRRIWAADGIEPYRQLPTSPAVPVWIGGSSGAARRRAARSADGWVPLFLSPSEYRSALGSLADEAEAAGRTPGDITRAVVVFASVGGDDARDRGTAWLSSLYGIPARAFDRHLVAGPAPAVAQELDRYLRAGAQHVVVMVTDDHPLEPFAALLQALGRDTPDPSFPAARRPDPVEVPA